jgi:hypothetical protein
MKKLLVVGCAVMSLTGCTAAQRMALAHAHGSRQHVAVPRVIEADGGPTTVTQNGITVTASCTSIHFTATGYPGVDQADVGVGGNPPAVIYMSNGGFDVTFPMSTYDRSGALYFSVHIGGDSVAHGKIGTGCNG